MFRRPFGRSLFLIAALAATGCSSAIRYPKLRGPGPAGYQRANAEAFDPYPLPDLGPPIDGGRPREFGIPRNEVERAQDYSIVQAARRGLPPGTPPNAMVAQPAVVVPPTTAPGFVPMVPTVPSTPQIYVPPPTAGTPMQPGIPPTTPYNQPSIRY